MNKKKNTNFAQKLATTHGTFNSFSALADALGVKAPEKREPRPVKCKVCGGEMTRAGNSNVWVCNNEVEKKVTRNSPRSAPAVTTLSAKTSPKAAFAHPKGWAFLFDIKKFL